MCCSYCCDGLYREVDLESKSHPRYPLWKVKWWTVRPQWMRAVLFGLPPLVSFVTISVCVALLVTRDSSTWDKRREDHGFILPFISDTGVLISVSLSMTMLCYHLRPHNAHKHSHTYMYIEIYTYTHQSEKMTIFFFLSSISLFIVIVVSNGIFKCVYSYWR